MTPDPLPEITADSGDEGFLDLAFRLIRLDFAASGEVHIEARGIYEGTLVAFAVDLNAQWDPQPIENADVSFYWGSGALRSLGPESDSFVAVLDRLYEASLMPSAMRKSVPILVVALGNDPRLMGRRPTKMKVFFEHESDDSNRYAEAYLNVFASETRLEFHEKDPEYRKPVVRALMGAAG